MAKLTPIVKELARNFKKEIAEKGGEIFYDNNYSRMSVVIIPHDSMKVDGFVEVYAAYCSPNDKFSKKRARLVLRDRVYNDNYILFPRANRSNYEVALRFFNLR